MAEARQLKLFIVPVAAAIGLYLCYRLALPFLPAMTWAMVFAIVLAPMHRRIETQIGNRNVAAFLSVTIALVLVAILLLFVVQQLVRDAINGADYLEEVLRNWRLDSLLASIPGAARVADWISERFDFAGVIATIGQWLTSSSTSVVVGSVNQVILLAMTFYMLFYFLRDRHEALQAVKTLLPLEPHETEHIIQRVGDTVRATLVGTVLVAAVQGALGGMMFWWLGLPTPVFWGLVMGLLAVVPVLGAFVIWVPAALYLALDGQWVSAAILTIWGGGVIATIDNLLYPMLVGNRLRMHTVVTFIGAIGGIVLFGASGLVLGPVVIVVTLSLVGILNRRLGRGAPFEPEVEPELALVGEGPAAKEMPAEDRLKKDQAG